jgi:hypothetical protein
MVHVVVGENRGEGIRVGTKALWDTTTDAYVHESFANVRKTDGFAIAILCVPLREGILCINLTLFCFCRTHCLLWLQHTAYISTDGADQPFYSIFAFRICFPVAWCLVRTINEVGSTSNGLFEVCLLVPPSPLPVQTDPLISTSKFQINSLS